MSLFDRVTAAVAAAHAPTPSPSTVRRYIKKLLFMQRTYAPGCDAAFPMWFSGDTARFDAWLLRRYSSLNSRAAYITAIAAILRWMPEHEALYRHYSAQVMQMREPREEMYAHARLQPGEEGMRSWTVTRRLLEERAQQLWEWSEQPQRQRNQELMMLLMLLHAPPRRVEDYRVLCFTHDPNEVDDRSKNWLVVHNKETTAYYHLFKTRRSYKQQQVAIHGLWDLLERLERLGALMQGKYIFTTRTGKLRTDSDMSGWISKVLARAGLPRCSQNSMRHSYVSALLQCNPTLDQKKQAARSMGTSVKELDEYNRHDLN